MVCIKVPLAIRSPLAKPNVVMRALIPAKNFRLTERGRTIGVVNSGKYSLILLGFAVTYYFSSGERVLRQNMARHKVDYCDNRTPQTDEAS